MLCAAIRQTLFRQNVSRKNSSNFSDIQYLVTQTSLASQLIQPRFIQMAVKQ